MNRRKFLRGIASAVGIVAAQAIGKYVPVKKHKGKNIDAMAHRVEPPIIMHKWPNGSYVSWRHH